MALAAHALVLALVSALAAQQPAGSQQLFDGSTLKGWDGDPKVWSVRDGCICGSTTGAPIAANTFLILKDVDVEDFEFTAAVRLEGDNNSGVQYRSERLQPDGFAVGGYQCDVHGEPRYFGMLYEERGHGIVATRGQRVERDRDGALRVLSTTATVPPVDLSAWHSLRIVARGETVQHFVDGELAIEFVDRAATVRRRGCLALQVHAGAPMTVWFKDLALSQLPKEEVAAVQSVAAVVSPVPQWIWDASPQDGEEVFFRRAFTLPAAVKQAAIAVSCDNHCRVYVNGERVATSDVWERPRFVDLSTLLRAGENVVAVHGWNDGGIAGLCAEVGWTLADGTHGGVSTGPEWRCGNDDPDGWDRAGFDDSAWSKATVLGPLGSGPWGGVLAADAFADLRPDGNAFVPMAATGLQVGDGYEALQLLAVPRSMGSWVSMCRDDRGRIYASDQSRGLYRVTLPERVAIGGAPLQVERVDVELGGCQGLCWAFGALYAVQNGGNSGLYRVTDKDGDDRLDTVELLRALDGSGEHGPHAVVKAPDGEHLLVICGNHTKVPQLARSRVPTNWRDDIVLPRIDDPNGHAVGIPPPGGFVCQVDRDGKEWELICCGFRNAYDLAVLPNGDVVTFDADMEWDMGLPWYRPTRICQVLSGVDYGWRNGSAKWRADLPDSLPALLDIGPGSPTGVASTERGVLALDWTFGLAHSVGLGPRGAALGSRALSAMARGKPLPLTDVVREPGGPATPSSYLLLTGGRGVPSKLFRLVPRGNAAADDRDADKDRRSERLALERFHGRTDAAALDAAWPFLADDDIVLRHAARIAIESQPVRTWRARARDEARSPWAVLTALLALARQGEAMDLGVVLRGLEAVPFQGLDHGQRVAWLRVHALALLRLGPCGPEVAGTLGSRLLTLFPCGDDELDADLAALLAYLEVDGLLARALPLLQPLRPASPPPWAEFVERNDSYGGAIAAMLRAMPPSGQLGIAYALRTVKNGWTTAQRQQFFAFLSECKKRKGGASYEGYLQAMVDSVWAGCSASEQDELRAIAGKDPSAQPEPFRATPPKGPGRHWELAEAVDLVRAGLGTRDLVAGRNLFHASGCAACHRFAGDGGGVGPDLTSLANKFRPADVLEAILEPSRAVSDQFAGAVLRKRDGSTVFGRIARRDPGAGGVYEVVLASAAAERVQVPASEVAAIEPAAISPMPAGLVDALSEGELLDLVAFLLGGGR